MRYDSEMGEGHSDRNRAPIVQWNNAMLWMQIELKQGHSQLFNHLLKTLCAFYISAVTFVTFAQINNINIIIHDVVTNRTDPP